MAKEIHARFSKGVIEPLGEVGLEEGEEITIIISKGTKGTEVMETLPVSVSGRKTFTHLCSQCGFVIELSKNKKKKIRKYGKTGNCPGCEMPYTMCHHCGYLIELTESTLYRLIQRKKMTDCPKCRRSPVENKESNSKRNWISVFLTKSKGRSIRPISGGLPDSSRQRH
jgi:predicted DNA-binding antitoxin AbrB/MazE fold protein